VRVLRQVGDRDAVAREDGAALDDVLQLAHVARPLARDQRLMTSSSMGLGLRAVLARELLHERLRQKRDVLDPLAQRRGCGSGRR
jgi:hypothetical protein